MTTYAVQTPVHAATGLTMVTPTSGDLAPTGPTNYLCVFNGSVSSITVTLPVPNVDGNLTVSSRTVTVAASTLAAPVIVPIPLPSTVYGTGTVAVTYSATTTVSVCVLSASVS